MNYRRNEDMIGCDKVIEPAYSSIISCTFANEGAAYDAVEKFIYYTATGEEGRSWLIPELKGFLINGRLYRDGIITDPSGAGVMNRQAIDVPGPGQYQWNSDNAILTLSDADPAPATGERFTIPYSANTDYFEPITLQEAKAYLRIGADETAFDDDVRAAISAARQEIEHYLNRSLINRTVTAVMNVANGKVSLPYSPVAAILAITDGAGNAIIADDYTLNNPVLKVPGYSRILCIYNAGGYTIANPVTPAFKAGIKRLMAFDWQNRGDGNAVRSIGAITTLKSYRRVV